jgi:hypothetical protein
MLFNTQIHGHQDSIIGGLSRISGKKIMKIFAEFILLLVILIGCAYQPPKQTKEEIIDLRNLRVESSKHTFKDVSIKKTEDAFVAFFDLLDGDDISYDFREGKILVRRDIKDYGLTYSFIGGQYWEIKYKQVDSDVLVSSTHMIEGNGGLFPNQHVPEFKENIRIGGMVNSSSLSVVDYKLLYSRIEYLLGQNDYWMTCEDALKLNKRDDTWLRLCKSVGLSNKSPMKEESN